MRLRNVKNAKEKILNSKYILKKEEIKSLGNNLYIEIGMGKGDFIIKKSIRNPDITFVGIEKYDSVLIRAIEKLDNLEIPNLKLIQLDAIDIDQLFLNQVDLIYLNFSDPWPKKKHSLRRLTSPVFLEKYDKIFNENKQIIMKTDNRKLFEYSIKTLTDFGYKIEEISLDLHKDDYPDNILTEYEQKFSSLGQNIYMINVKKGY